jgi:hypothetical protein
MILESPDRHRDLLVAGLAQEVGGTLLQFAEDQAAVGVGKAAADLLLRGVLEDELVVLERVGDGDEPNSRLHVEGASV